LVDFYLAEYTVKTKVRKCRTHSTTFPHFFPLCFKSSQKNIPSQDFSEKSMENFSDSQRIRGQEVIGQKGLKWANFRLFNSKKIQKLTFQFPFQTEVGENPIGLP